VGPRAGLDRRKFFSPPGFDPGSSSPKSAPILTELPGLQNKYNNTYNNLYKNTVLFDVIFGN
jgi:hypothetical protein